MDDFKNAILSTVIYFFVCLFKDVGKDDYIGQKNNIVRYIIKRDGIPNTASAHHIQIHITQNPTDMIIDISLLHSSYQERL